MVKVIVECLVNFKHIAITIMILPAHALSSELVDSYIDIQIKNKLHPFRLVLMSEDESPYVSLTNLSKWTDSEVSCSNDVCTVDYLDGYYNISFSDLIYTDNKGTCDLKEDSFLLKNEQYWIHYSIINECLPYNVTWSKRLYELVINPNFKLRSEKILDNKTARERSKNKSKQKEKKAFKPKGNFDTQLSLSVSSTFSSYRDTSSNSRAEIISDIAGGSLFGSVISQDGVLDSDWSYENFESTYVEHYKLGSGRSPEGTLMSSVDSKSSIFIDKIKTSNAKNKFTINEMVSVNSSVDLYKNGFFIKTMEPNKFGLIYDNDIKASPGDRLTLKIYSNKGIYTEKNFSIGGDDTFLLSKGDFDYKIYSDTDNNRRYGSLNYGLIDGLTLGVSLERENEYQINSFQYEYQPNYWLLLSGDINPEVSIYSLSWNFFQKSPIYLEMGRSSGSSELLRFDDDYYKIEHSWGSGRFYSESEVFNSDKYLNLDSTLRYKLNSKQSVNFNVNHTNKNDEAFRSFGMGINTHRSSIGSWDLSYKNNAGKNEFKGSFKYFYQNSLFNESKGNYLSFNIDSIDGYISYAGSLSWDFGEFISGSLSADDKSVSLSISLSTTLSNSYKKLTSEYSFGKSYIDGRIYTKSTKGEIVPIPNIRVTASGLKSTTNDNGYYQFEGISANSNVTIFVNKSDLDIDMYIEETEKVVHMRPSTYASIDFIVVPVIGIDGVVEIKGAEYLVVKGVNFKKEVKLESDGFYVMEGIPENDSYAVEILDLNRKVIYQVKSNISGEYWISEFNFRK